MTENKQNGGAEKPALGRLRDQPLGERRVSAEGRSPAEDRRPVGSRTPAEGRSPVGSRPPARRVREEDRPVVERRPRGEQARRAAYGENRRVYAGPNAPRPDAGSRPEPGPRPDAGPRPEPGPRPESPREEYAFQAKQAARRRRRRVKRIALLAALALVVLGVFAVRLVLDLNSGADTFYPGVSVDGLKLNGYTMEEAREKLVALNADRLAAMTVRLAYNDREWSIAPEQMGVELDIDEKLEAAWNLGREGNIFSRQGEIRRLKQEGQNLSTALSYDETALREKLGEVKEAIDLPAVDASISFDPSAEEKFTITPESSGRDVDVSILVGQVKTQLDNGFTTVIEVKPDIVSPTVFAADLEQATTRIVRTSTDLGDSSDARIHNIKTALSYFNGMVVQPGQEVSFNATTGPRGLEQGYQNAGVIEDDEIVDGPGGGVCQVSTTLYQALVKANIEIVRSNKHSMPVSYVDVGTDAAVAYDYKDLIFKNNTDYPIFLEGRVSGNSVVFSIYGYPLEEGTEIEIVTDVYETIEPEEPKIILDTEGEHVTYTDETKVKKKARDGIKVRSYRVIKKDGEEVSRELLRDDYYKEVQGEIYQGVTPRTTGEEGLPDDPTPVEDGAQETPEEEEE